MRARLAWAFAGLALCAGGGAARVAHADEDFGVASVIFARGSSLYRTDPRGKTEAEIARLAAQVSVRALRSDARGTVLLADLAGRWAWMPLDGSTRSLTDLPCADGPAQLAEDGGSVVCRSPGAAGQTIVVDLATKLPPLAIQVPPGGVRPIGSGIERRFVWADATGVWTAPAFDPKRKTRIAPDAPLRGFIASPDGTRGIGVYADQVYSDLHNTRPADVLMTVQLDGQGARRKAIREGVVVEWSHDSQWILVQDGASACIMRAGGGQYKCWKGFTAASISSDGQWALVLGNRDGSRKGDKADKRDKSDRRDKRENADKADKADKADRRSARRSDPEAKPWDRIDEPSNEPEAGEAPAVTDDVNVAPPSGPLALYRVRIGGAFTDRPTLLVKVVDGAAVWVPSAP